jgi:hypothetical protein
MGVGTMIRRRLVLVLLGFIALWPAVTLALQARWDVDPWKLMGFGMYATPARRLEDFTLVVEVRRGERWEQVELASEEGTRFLARRRTWGRLASPEPMLRRLLEASGANAASAELQFTRLNPRTARVTVERERVSVSR